MKIHTRFQTPWWKECELSLVNLMLVYLNNVPISYQCLGYVGLKPYFTETVIPMLASDTWHRTQDIKHAGHIPYYWATHYFYFFCYTRALCRPCMFSPTQLHLNYICGLHSVSVGLGAQTVIFRAWKKRSFLSPTSQLLIPQTPEHIQVMEGLG